MIGATVRRLFIVFTGAAALYYGFCNVEAVAAVTGQNAVKVTKPQPVKWFAVAERVSPTKAKVTVKAIIQDGWHIYGFDMPDGGPMATGIEFSLPKGVKPDGKLKPSRQASRKFDVLFDSEVEFWTGKEIVFTQYLKLEGAKAGDAVGLKCTVSFMGCNDDTCLPPKSVILDVNIPAE